MNVDRSTAPGSRELRGRVHLVVAVSCAFLVPFVVLLTARLTEDGGLARAGLAWVIALLSGVAVYAWTSSRS